MMDGQGLLTHGLCECANALTRKQKAYRPCYCTACKRKQESQRIDRKSFHLIPCTDRVSDMGIRGVFAKYVQGIFERSVYNASLGVLRTSMEVQR
jgi:hypothetical protein